MDQTIAMINKAHNGDKKAREQLVSENLGLVWSIVRRYENRGICADIKLIQIR